MEIPYFPIPVLCSHVMCIILQINMVMSQYLSTNGYFLVRPSASSEGQFTLAVRYA